MNKILIFGFTHASLELGVRLRELGYEFIIVDEMDKFIQSRLLM